MIWSCFVQGIVGKANSTFPLLLLVFKNLLRGYSISHFDTQIVSWHWWQAEGVICWGVKYHGHSILNWIRECSWSSSKYCQCFVIDWGREYLQSNRIWKQIVKSSECFTKALEKELLTEVIRYPVFKKNSLKVCILNLSSGVSKWMNHCIIRFTSLINGQ